MPIRKSYSLIKLGFVNSTEVREISGSHGDEYEDGYLLECCAV
jgi:hypothetical protein